MKTILAALALVAFIASPALAAPHQLPSYDCVPIDDDSSDAVIAAHCE